MKRMTQSLHSIFKSAWKSERYGRILLILSIACLAGYLTACLIAPAHRIRQLNRESGLHASGTAGTGVTVPGFPECSPLVRQSAFLESRIAMAGTDSIGMSVNLKDSILSLEINGITLHRARIRYFRADRFFLALNDEAYAGLFSQPLFIERDCGTIDREPVIVQKAPRDTAEAVNSFFIPDTVQRIPVYAGFELDRGIRLRLEGDTRGGWARPFRKLLFHAGWRVRETGRNIRSILSMRVPLYRPEIRIGLEEKDAATVYRALYGRSPVAIMI